MAIPHKAFLDLEDGLTSRLNVGFRRLYAPLKKDLKSALLNKDWHEADRLIDTLDTTTLVTANARYAQTIGMSAMLLGASRLSSVKDSKIATDPPTQQLSNLVTQWGYQVARNAPRLITRALHVKVALLEHQLEKSRQKIRKDAAEQFGPALYDFEYDAEELVNGAEIDATQFMSLTSSLMVSRLSSFGFLVQAQDQGIRSYQISEVLDENTCPVCEVMDGQIFSVDAGISQATSIMGAEDPDSLASVAPWPSQSKASVADLADSSAEDLVDAGLALPPYHPLCRGIVVAAVDESDSDTADEVEDVASDIDLPSVSLGTLTAILGIAGGTLFPARKHRGQELQGLVDDDEDSDAYEDDNSDETDDEDPKPRKRPKKKQDQIT